MYAVYILLCADYSYYTGLSDDLDKRLWQHETGYFPDCYTYKRRPVKLVWHTIVETADEANDLEKQIKGWSRKKKEALIKSDITELKRLSNYKKEKPTSSTLRPAQGQIEYLIIGQGICGTFLSWYLHKEKRSFIVIDNNQPDSASRVASGIINPVTGRRIVKTWMIDELIPFIKNAYSDLGNELDITAISEKKIIDFFPTAQMRNAFLERKKEDESFLHLPNDENSFNQFFNYELGYGIISPAFIVHIEKILPEWRKKLQLAGKLQEESFDLSQLKIEPDKIKYKDIIAGKIIFCDGIASFNNPHFQYLPFAFNKGEVLIIEANDLLLNDIYKKGIVISPLQEKGKFWVGSNYLWDYKDNLPSKDFFEQTKKLLNDWLKVPFKILEHRSAIRPANIERRPFVGMHPHFPNIGILNGMGTKGCSLAPYFARQFCDHLVYKKDIMKEADIKRFSKILAKQ